MSIQDEVSKVVSEQPEEMGLTTAVVVQQRGEVVAEAYGPDTTANSQLLSWSMAKSVTHALAGLLVAEGELSLDGPAPVPQWSDPQDPRHEISLDNLLRMSPGLKFVEDYVDDQTSDCLEMLFGSGKSDMASYAANQPLVLEPGTQVNYASGTTNIISAMLAQIVGRRSEFEEWANERLFSRIEMNRPRMTFDDAGTWVGSSYLYATAREFVNFGQLYLNGGTFGGDRILSQEWVDHGRTVTGKDIEGNDYCAHWWGRNPEKGIYAAQGYETQRIIVWPKEDLIVARFGKTPIDMAPNVDSWLSSLIGE